LVIPAYTMQVLWLVGSPYRDTAFITAVVPSAYAALLERLRTYEAREFFERLRRVQHVQGILP
jgi:hypothetical protein